MRTSTRFWLAAAPLALLFGGCVPTPEEGLGAAEDNIGGVTVEGSGACSFTQGGWGSACNGQNVGCLRDAWFSTVFPGGMTVGAVAPKVLATSADVEAYLPQGGPPTGGVHSSFYGQMTALKLNLAFSAGGAFGAAGGLDGARVKGGSYNGWTAPALLAYAESISPSLATGALVSALSAINEGFEVCDPGNLPPSDPDGDGDGVPQSADCNDANPLIGALLYENFMSTDTGYLAVGPTLTDPWVYGGGVVSNTKGGQQAFLGQAEGWADTVTFLWLAAHGSMSGCGWSAPDCNPERFRAGVVARQTIDADQDEGFHGYRCAVAMNAATDCYEPGPFVQLAAFLDGPEDDINSECTAGCPPNPTFDQLDRANRSNQTDLLAGDPAMLTFWAVGSQLECVFDGLGGEHVVTSAVDERFASGGTGLSVSNALGDFDHIKVCQAFGVPAAPPADPDGDGDGVPESADCDDTNPLIGALLYENNMSSDTGYFAVGPTLTDPWAYGGGVVSNTWGGQQAFLGEPSEWENTVTFLTLSAHGSTSGCSSDAPDCNPERFRAGVLARQSVDADQDEGYHGYRCAVAVNAATDCYEPGPFVQLAAFLDGPEDDISSECTAGCPPNPTFDQLDRTDRSAETDVLAGDTAQLTFWAVGPQLVCTFDGKGGEHVRTTAEDGRFMSGGTGLSTLNALGDFDHLRVCHAFGVPPQ